MNKRRLNEVREVINNLDEGGPFDSDGLADALQRIIAAEKKSQDKYTKEKAWIFLGHSLVCVSLMEGAVKALRNAEDEEAFNMLSTLVLTSVYRDETTDFSFLGMGISQVESESGPETLKIDTAGRIREDIQSFEDALLEKLILPKPGETVEKKLSAVLENTKTETGRYSGFVKRISEVFGGTGDKANKEYRFLGKQAKKAVAKTFLYPDSRYKIVAITPDVPASAVQELYTALFGDACVAVGTILDGQMNIYLSKAYANAV